MVAASEVAGGFRYATEWLRELPGSLVEVYCQCAPQFAVERFCQRERHPGHLDARRSKEDLLTQLTEAAQFGPLNIGTLVKVDTEKRIDFEALWKHVQSAS